MSEELDNNKYLMSDEPESISHPHDIRKLLMHLVESNGSDFFLLNNYSVLMSVDGIIRPVTHRKITTSEIEFIAKTLYNSANAVAQVISGHPINDAYEVKDSANNRVRFRYNVLHVEHGGVSSLQITIRYIPTDPYPPSKLQIEKEILENVAQDQGMVVVTGPTGSGKTTLLSSCIRWLLESKHTNLKIDSYENPPEFVYDNLEWNNNMITQAKIGSGVASYSDAIEESLRRKPNIIMVGEARSAEEISQCVKAAQTGHGVISTMHTNGAAETVFRMVNVFPYEERASKLVDIIDSLKMVVAQRLVPKKGGGRVAVKEIFIPTYDERRDLMELSYKEIKGTINRILDQNQRSFRFDIARKLKADLITEETYKDFIKKYC